MGNKVGFSVACTTLLVEDGWRFAPVLAKGVTTASSGNISDAVSVTMLVSAEVSVSLLTEYCSASGDDVGSKDEEVLVTVGVGIVVNMLVVLVELGNILSSSGGGGLTLVLTGTLVSSLVVASVVVVVVDLVVVAGNRESRPVAVRTLLNWTALSIAVHRLPPVVVKMNDLADEGRLGDDMLKLDHCTSVPANPVAKQTRIINIGMMDKRTRQVTEENSWASRACLCRYNHEPFASGEEDGP